MGVSGSGTGGAGAEATPSAFTTERPAATGNSAGSTRRGYRIVGPYWIPLDSGAARLYWRSVYGGSAGRRRRMLGALAACFPQTALAWAAGRRAGAAQLDWAPEIEAQLALQLGVACRCVWRPAAPGVSRAALRWVGRGRQLVALARMAEGANCGFLEREWRALLQLQRWGQRAAWFRASTPQLLRAESRPGRLVLIESVCAGHPSRAAEPAAAVWLGRWQSLSGETNSGAQRAWRARLDDAITAHLGLAPATRLQLRERLAQTADPPLVAAHGDFWHGNLLYSRQLGGATSRAGARCRPSKLALKRPTGATKQKAASRSRGGCAVVDWSEYHPQQHPFHDAGFFLLTCGRDQLSSTGHARPLPPAEWLRRAFAPGAPFRRQAQRWFEQYRAARSNSNLEFTELLQYLPLTMAHYACFGQQAAAWTAACNAWAANPELLRA